MESFEHRGRSNRFLLCFRPLPMAGSLKPDRSQHHSADQVLAYIAVGDKDRHGLVVPAAIISPLPDHNHNAASGQDFSPRRKIGCFTRQFSKVLKSVLFETTLVKRIRSRKSRKDSFRTDDTSENEKFSNLIRDNLGGPEPPEFQCGAEYRRTKSSTSVRPQRSASASQLRSAPMCPKCSSSPASNLRFSHRKIASSLKKPPVQRNTAELIQKRASHTGLCFFLISLCALVFWGKICAIFCASTWLLLLPHYNHEIDLSDRRESPDHHVFPDNLMFPDNHKFPAKYEFPDKPELPEYVESVDHKKKVVMGGLLERNGRWNTHTASFWPNNTHSASFLPAKF